MVSLFFFRILSHFYVGSMILIRRLLWTRSWASSPDNSLSDKSFLMLSNHHHFGLPLLLFPGTSITLFINNRSNLLHERTIITIYYLNDQSSHLYTDTIVWL